VVVMIILCAAVGGVVAIGLYLNKIAFYPKTWSYEETFRYEVDEKRFDPEWFLRLQKEEVILRSPFGYPLHAIWVKGIDSGKTVIFAHGYTYSLFGSVKYMKVFLKRGYNILLYDHRYHGKSGGKSCTMGFRETEDLKAITDYCVQKSTPPSLIVTHGESMGGATVLLHGAIDHRVSAIISDCPYKSVWDQFKYRLKVEYKLPAFPFLTVADGLSKAFIGTRFRTISPINALDQVHCPVMFVHGEEDRYIPKASSIEMYRKKKGTKRLYLAKGADHAQAYISNPKEYEAQVDQFLSQIESQKITFDSM